MPAPSAAIETSPTPKFSDAIAILNPLQHLPIVGTLYRKMTGDEPHPAARVLGGLLWGGPIGLMGAALTYIAEQVSGKNATELVKSIFDGSETKPPTVAEPAPPDGDVSAKSEPAPAAAASAPAVPAAEAAPARPAATPASPSDAQAPQPGATITQARPRTAATRDLAAYWAHAGTRLPAAVSAAAPIGQQSAPQPAPFHRAVTPVLGAEPSGAAAQATRAPAAAAGAMMPDTTNPDFAQRMLQGLERYQATSRAAESRKPVLDRAE